MKPKTLCADKQKSQIIKSKFWKNFTVQSSILIVLLGVFFIMFIAHVEGRLAFFNNVLAIRLIDEVFSYIQNLSILPLIIIALPFIGGIGQFAFGRHSHRLRDMLVIFMTFITIVLVLFSYPEAINGGLSYTLPTVLGLGLNFQIDMLSFTMLLLTSMVWFYVMIYAHEYMMREQHCNRFFFFMAITYGAVLGTIVAGDLLTLFLFLEIMTFSSYMLVVHGQKEESYQAGYNYIFMGLLGGFTILIAIFLLYYYVGDLRFASMIVELNAYGNIKYWVMGLLVFGFGVKAGMAPVHVWLPRAHPVAPTPASALLSGIMIKVGAYGILRVAVSYFFPLEGEFNGANDSVWVTTENIGMALIWFGIITMAIGVFLALQQSHIKRMLAYHSVSQMGYILMGIGTTLYLGYDGAVGYAGAMYHIINHALFKSLLFMVAGVVYYHTKETDMYKLGGLWKKLPLTTIVCLIAALGISGIPLFNGFISKTILHHSIVEAYHLYNVPSLFFAELIFIIISAGTVCSFIKLFYYVFLRKTKNTYNFKREYNNLDAAMLAIAVLIVLIGIFPHFIIERLLIPQLYQATFDSYHIAHLMDLQFFIGSELLMMLGIVALGFVIFLIGTKFHLFHLHLPGWLRIDYIFFLPMNFVMRLLCKKMHGQYCTLDIESEEKLKLKNNYKIGFIERLIITSNMFNKRFESTIIKSDSFIYALFITGILLFMAIISIIN